MMSLDDQLRDLFQAEGPDAAELQGDVQQVRAEVRRRTFRRRAAFGAIAAAVVAAGALVLTGVHAGDDVRTDLPPVTEQETTTTTAPRTSTTDGTGVTTGSGSPSSSTSTPSSTTTPPAPPDIRDIALGDATYTQACAGFGNTQSATLNGGTARLSSGGNTYDVTLGPVGYADADGDGDEDAVLLLGCKVTAATQDDSAQLRAYRTTSGGGIEQIGSSQLVEHIQPDPTADGLSITVERVEYADADPDCCPSMRFQEIWTFDGGAFEKTFSTPVAFPDF
jgi:hypothetical protein